MPDLHQTLLKHDLGFLKIIAEFWGLEMHSREPDSAAEELSAALLDPAAVHETLDILPPEARSALTALFESNGKMEWGRFARKFGGVREMGEGKRDREKPHLKPVSAAEILYYRGLMAKAFFDSGRGAQEFAYIPEDLMPLIKMGELEASQGKGALLGRPATLLEKSFERPATDSLLDEAATLLAALRIGKADFTPDPRLPALMNSAGILRNHLPQPETAKAFLSCARPAALEMLYRAWIDSQSFNELHLIPDLVCEGEWTNSPRETRRTIIKFIDALPRDKWWSLAAFLRDLKTKHPDFQRPAGDYDSWFIKRGSDGQYLRGFVYWDQVDGAVARAVIEMLHRLGRLDLASAEREGAATAFRIPSLVPGREEKGRLGMASNGKITVPGTFPRAVRYQLARFCEWDEQNNAEYKYRITARSLRHAGGQGLKADQLLSLLVKHSNGNVPPALVEALKRWEANGIEARVEKLVVLKAARPEVLEELRRSKVGKFLGEILGPTAVVVKEGAVQKVLAGLAELGLFADVEKEG